MLELGAHRDDVTVGVRPHVVMDTVHVGLDRVGHGIVVSSTLFFVTGVPRVRPSMSISTRVRAA